MCGNANCEINWGEREDTPILVRVESSSTRSRQTRQSRPKHCQTRSHLPNKIPQWTKTGEADEIGLVQAQNGGKRWDVAQKNGGNKSQ